MDKYLQIVSKTHPIEHGSTDGFEFYTIIDDDGKTPLWQRDFAKELEDYDNLTEAEQSKVKLTKIEKKTLASCVHLSRALHEQGYSLSLVSAFRSVDEQQKLFEEFVEKEGEKAAKEKVALPGTSEHHLGLAVDLRIRREQKAVGTLPQNFLALVRKLPVIRSRDTISLQNKLIDIAPDFGLIQRYPKGKEKLTGITSERWHFRYVGEYAKEIAENGLCLEEFVAMKSKEI